MRPISGNPEVKEMRRELCLALGLALLADAIAYFVSGSPLF